jgi:hypothetical protein
MSLNQRLNMFYRRIDTLSGKMLLLVAIDTFLWVIFLVMSALKLTAFLGVSDASIAWIEILAPGLAAIVTTVIGAIAMKKGGRLG